MLLLLRVWRRLGITNEIPACPSSPGRVEFNFVHAVKPTNLLELWNDRFISVSRMTILRDWRPWFRSSDRVLYFLRHSTTNALSIRLHGVVFSKGTETALILYFTLWWNYNGKFCHQFLHVTFFQVGLVLCRSFSVVLSELATTRVCVWYCNMMCQRWCGVGGGSGDSDIRN